VAVAQGSAEVTLRLVDVAKPVPVPVGQTTTPVPAPVSAAPAPVEEGSLRPPATFLAGLVSLLVVTILTVGSILDIVLAPNSTLQTTTLAAPSEPAQPAALGAAPAALPPPAAPPAPPAQPPSPVLPPPSAADVQSVTLQSQTPSCAPGSVCHVRVSLAIRPSRSVHLQTWTLYAIDGCTGGLTPLGTAGANVLRGWTRVIGDSYPHVPRGHASGLVAITNGAARASSAPITLAAPPGCAG
jgi:hypothetical protein